MDIQFPGKTALVTGSTSGIGYAVAKALAESGASVVLNGRTEEHVAAAVERLREEVLSAAPVLGIAADLSTGAGARHLVAHIEQVDILVNNLGVFDPKPFLEITDEDWESYFQVNVMAGVRLSRHYARYMISKGWGRIIFNASVTGGFFPGEMVHYGATKAALLGLARGLAESLGGSGITVNSVIPGPTFTDKTAAFVTKSGEGREQMEKRIFNSVLTSSLIKRFMSPAEVASLVVFLASEQASAITGASLRVDGGIVRTIP